MQHQVCFATELILRAPKQCFNAICLHDKRWADSSSTKTSSADESFEAMQSQRFVDNIDNNTHGTNASEKSINFK